MTAGFVAVVNNQFVLAGVVDNLIADVVGSQIVDNQIVGGVDNWIAAADSEAALDDNQIAALECNQSVVVVDNFQWANSTDHLVAITEKEINKIYIRKNSA